MFHSDPRLPTFRHHAKQEEAYDPLERKPRALNFVTPGKYVKLAQNLRMKQIEEDVKINRVEVRKTK